jgi:hypothetical protein
MPLFDGKALHVWPQPVLELRTHCAHLCPFLRMDAGNNNSAKVPGHLYIFSRSVHKCGTFVGENGRFRAISGIFQEQKRGKTHFFAPISTQFY